MDQIKHNELTFHLMLEATPCALVLVNAQGKVAYSNAYTEKLFQYSKREMIGKMIWTFLQNDNKNESHILIQEHLKDPANNSTGCTFELNAQKKDGSGFPVEIEMNPIITIDGEYILIAIKDVTERKRSEMQFRMLVESAPNAMVLVDSQGNISMVNRQVELMFGYERHELIGSKPEVLLPKEYREAHLHYRQQFSQHHAYRMMGVGRDLFAQRKDGTFFPVEIGLNPIESADGVLVLAAIIDITERKKNEAKHQVYVRRIEEKNEELKQSEQKLKALNATKDKLFSIISHDLRGPIGNMKLALECLISGFDLSDTQQLSLFLHQVHSAASTTYDLLENLLNWAKSQGGRIDFDPTIISLNEIVEASISLVEDATSRKKISIINSITPNRLIFADKHMLMTIIRNLISNAVKFTPKNKKIYLSIRKADTNWLISVKDEGVGIHPDNIHKIFNNTETFTTHGTDNEKGSGLGLMLCKEFVEKHGGHIWVESVLGEGCDFKFTIPLMSK